MNKVELNVIGLSSSVSQDGKNYALILQEANGERKFPVIVGTNEGQSIALVMERIKPVRPITHDLFKNIIEALGAVVNEVVITSIESNTFYAQISLTRNGEKLPPIDARPSDAIALALRFGSPIYTFDFVLNEAAIIENSGKLVLKKGSFAEYTLEELEELLASILQKEDYESAARVRDVIERRKEAKR